MLSRPSTSQSVDDLRAGRPRVKPVNVSIRSITIAYGETVPVKELSLDVRPGEFLSLLGPSGCGKTTTLRAVAGFVTPRSGDIWIGEQSVIGVPPNRRSIGMVYQNYALFPHMTVADNIAFGMKMRGYPRADISARVPRLLAQLRLSAFAQRYPKQLSGGQQQRVALARALAFDPSVLLLDEPLAALDKQLRGDMQFELRKLQREIGITTIFVTHDQEEALSLSDRVAVLNEGKILQVDAPREVYGFPKHRFVAEFIGEANILSSTIFGSPQKAMFKIAGLESVHRIDGTPSNGDVSILLRPETLRLHASTDPVPDGRNALHGRVVNSVFVGTTLKYQIEIGPDRIVRVDSPAHLIPAAIGDTVMLSWSPSDARVYHNDLLET